MHDITLSKIKAVAAGIRIAQVEPNEVLVQVDVQRRVRERGHVWLRTRVAYQRWPLSLNSMIYLSRVLVRLPRFRPELPHPPGGNR